MLTTAQIIIELCCLSYLDDGNTKGPLCEQEHRIKKAIKKGMESPAYNLGDWSVPWGPVLSEDSIFMMYVAGNQKSNEYAVVVRGTNPHSIKAWLTDLDVSLVAPPYGSGLSIAQGALDGINALNAMSSHSQTLVQYLEELVQKNPSNPPTIYITGHSFGATLAIAYAPWLVAQGSDPQVVTFAGPSAGDAAFAAYFNQLFPDAESYVNTLDAVPNLWASVLDIPQLYQPPGPACPSLVSDLLELVNDLIPSYQQTGGQIQQTYTVQETWNWFKEVGDQHDHFTYAALQGLNLPSGDELEIQALLASRVLGTSVEASVPAGVNG